MDAKSKIQITNECIRMLCMKEFHSKMFIKNSPAVAGRIYTTFIYIHTQQQLYVDCVVYSVHNSSTSNIFERLYRNLVYVLAYTTHTYSVGTKLFDMNRNHWLYHPHQIWPLFVCVFVCTTGSGHARTNVHTSYIFIITSNTTFESDSLSVDTQSIQTLDVSAYLLVT